MMMLLAREQVMMIVFPCERKAQDRRNLAVGEFFFACCCYFSICFLDLYINFKFLTEVLVKMVENLMLMFH